MFNDAHNRVVNSFSSGASGGSNSYGLVDINNLNFNSDLLSGANVQTGFKGRGSILTGVDGVKDVFFLQSPGSTIRNFDVGEDVLAIISDNQPLTYLDIVNPLAPQLFTVAPGSSNPTDTRGIVSNLNGGAEVRVPIRSTRLSYVTLDGVDPSQLANSPESFAIFSQGNQVIDYNELMFDAGRIGAVPPAEAAIYFGLVQAAIADAVLGVERPEGLQTYLESIDVTLPGVSDGASAEAAAAAAGAEALRLLFTDSANTVIDPNPLDPNNPLASFTPSGGTPVEKREFITRVFDSALQTSLAEINDTEAAINAGVNFGRQIAQQLYQLRMNDGLFRNPDGSIVNRAAFNAEYQDGIEPNSSLNEETFQDEGSILLNDGTVSRLKNGAVLLNSAAPVRTINAEGNVVINSIAPTSPGAWRRAEDTLNAQGQFAGLASPLIAELDQTWVIPDDTFFFDTVQPPPALDSQRYIRDVEEVSLDGSLLDIPIYNSGSTQVSFGNRTITNDGTTQYLGTGVLGTAINDTNNADSPYNDFGMTRPDRFGTTSEERTIIGHIFANAEGSYGPNYTWQKIAQQLAINNNSDLVETAQVFATLDLAIADGFINIWSMKWDEDYFWRPVSSIRNAEQLGGTAYLDDNTWTPREVTPQHPCHPSGTSMTAAIGATILANFFGDTQTVTVGSDVHPNSVRLSQALTSVNGNDNVAGVDLDSLTRTYNSLSQLANEQRTSRIYAGAHFRFATENGVSLGDQVARYIIRENPYVVPETVAQSNAPGSLPVLS